MKKVLFIALEFAPIQQTGSFRSMKFVKYLRDYGIDPVLVTIDPADASRLFNAPIDPALSEELGYEPPTYYLRDGAPIGDESRLRQFLRIRLRLTDGFFARFQESLLAQIDKIRSEHDLSCVYVTLPPFGAGKLALAVVRQTALPLVVDMRDAWSQWANTPFSSYLHYRSVLAQERELLTRASAITTVTDELSRMFQESHRKISRDQFHVIPNGFDGIDLQDRDCTPGSDPELFQVAYVGSYYYNPDTDSADDKHWFRRTPHRWLDFRPVRQQWLYRTPYFFFQSVAQLRKSDEQLAAQVRFHQIGHTPAWLLEMANGFGLGDQIVSHGIVPRHQVRDVLQNVDACLVTSIKVPGGEDYCLASKTFDYIQAGKQLLGFVCPGSQKKFLADIGGSHLFDPDAPEYNASLLMKIIRDRKIMRFLPAPLAKYERRRAAKELATVLDNCAAEIATSSDPDSLTRSIVCHELQK